MPAIRVATRLELLSLRLSRYARSFSNVPLRHLLAARSEDVSSVPEVHARRSLANKLAKNGVGLKRPASALSLRLEDVGMTPENMRLAVEVALMTFLLHVESRLASLVGHGFYTIGPCGEESLGAVGLLLQPGDASALHYRHLATSLARARKAGKPRLEVLLARARGYTVSSLDPVTGAGHCCLGGEPNEFVVTSTLASQAPPAVGRGLAIGLAKRFLPRGEARFPANSLSYVSIGDGSANNAHFLAAWNMAEYAEHRGFKCPVVFGISDNGLCISLKGYGWIDKLCDRFRMPLFRAHGDDVLDVYRQASAALEFSRQQSKPAVLLFSGVNRRFGHAATDRQSAYLTEEQIEAAADNCSVSALCAQAVDNGVFTYAELSTLFQDIQAEVEEAFDMASQEPKLSTRSELMARTRQPPHLVPALAKTLVVGAEGGQTREPMRKNMKHVFQEAMSENPAVVYLGEDVRHGGYYLVTDGLAEKFPERVIDFPPDETSLIGVGIGFSQAKLVPIVEIPYAKYLDCGADMFFEAAIYNWLSAGKQPNGMVIRMQGFDRGVFGGNFHTHNALYFPPGVDVVCYSNGEDYVRGMRNAIVQATTGRIVMSVDCTALLNLLHLHENDKDNLWRRRMPAKGEVMGFDEVRVYPSSESDLQNAPSWRGCSYATASPVDTTYAEGNAGSAAFDAGMAIVTYGNGVVTALQARRVLKDRGFTDIDVIDCPYLSDVPAGLKEVLRGTRGHRYLKGVLFADICKHGQGPLAAHIMSLHSLGVLDGAPFRHVAAPRTYNPLGSTISFLNVEDIVNGVQELAAVAV